MRNNISRHIERLLLTNDRVAIPSFGVFNVTHIAAEYMEATGLFYPPKRVVGFVVDKTACDNDALLLQSYADALNISIPEAQRVLENDLYQIQVQLREEGEYYFHGVGTLTKYEDNSLGFEADLAGIATPNLFGLNSFEFKPLQAQVTEPAKKTAHIISMTPFSQHLHTLTPLRKVAAAAVAVFVGFSFISIPVGNGSDKTKVIQASILSSDVINSIVESPTSHNVAVTQEEIAQFEQAANYKEGQEEVQAPTTTPAKENEKTTQVVTAAPTTVTVNISYDDMKKVVEEHEQETVVNEKDSLS